MNNNDYLWFFIVSTVINTDIAIYNSKKNIEQDSQTKEILEKLDKILELLNER